MPQGTRNLIGRMGVRFGLAEADRAICAQRLNEGLDPANYGPTNHLQPDFDVIEEALAELYDAFNMIACMGPRRAELALHGKLPPRDLVFGDSDRWIDACQHIACGIRCLQQLRHEQDEPPDEAA